MKGSNFNLKRKRSFTRSINGNKFFPARISDFTLIIIGFEVEDDIEIEFAIEFAIDMLIIVPRFEHKL